MRKGISTIIATIILLVITISLAGTAYLFMSGMITGQTSQTISILSASCNTTHIMIVVSNTGTKEITASDIKIYVNEQYAGPFGKTIKPHETEANSTISTAIQDGVNTLVVISPSNSIRETVWC